MLHLVQKGVYILKKEMELPALAERWAKSETIHGRPDDLMFPGHTVHFAPKFYLLNSDLSLKMQPTALG